MKKIPKGLKKEIADDPFYNHCCLRHIGTCDAEGVQWHHNLEHEGQQVNEKFCILPLCPHHHEHIYLPKARWEADKIMIERATEEQISKYNLRQRKQEIGEGDVPW